MDQKPLVSVYMTTYFHEKYIAQALDSILNQKTNFPYEIVISDDNSKDRTVQIINTYINKYNFIHLHVNSTNVGLTRNMFIAKSMCKGKYCTALSGDDYWIDDFKLQKQFDFLKAHGEYAAVCTVVEARADNDLKAFASFPGKKFLNKDFTLDMFLKGNNYPLNGIMTKNFLLDEEKRNYFAIMPEVSSYIDDLTDSILILQMGKVYIMSGSTVAYRVRRKTKGDKNFNSQNTGLRNYERHIEMLNNLDAKLNGNVDLLKRYVLVVTNGMIKSLTIKQYNHFKEIFDTIPCKYKDRGLMRRCILHIPKEVFVAVKNRIRAL